LPQAAFIQAIGSDGLGPGLAAALDVLPGTIRMQGAVLGLTFGYFQAAAGTHEASIAGCCSPGEVLLFEGPVVGQAGPVGEDLVLH
jgi:hypothetical protein